MSRNTLIISILSLSIIAITVFYLRANGQENEAVIVAPDVKYELIWEDNFSGNEIDWTKWSKCKRYPPHWCSHMTDDERLYELRNGRLRLYCLRNDGILPNDTASVLTGGLTTRDKFTFGFGKVEVRARMTGAMGCWPAIWIHNTERGDDNINRGEIDLVEHYNHDKIIHHTVHNYYNGYQKSQKHDDFHFSYDVNVKKWNTYSVEILPESLIIKVNNKISAIYPKISNPSIQGQYPYGSPSFLILSMQWANPWLKDLRPEELPSWMEIDWVRVYKISP